MCVCEVDLQFSMFLQSQTTYWVQMPTGMVGICTQMSVDSKTKTQELHLHLIIEIEIALWPEEAKFRTHPICFGW